ncbi:MAG: transcription termination/antitermination protein NusG [Symbiobacterium thermophilum]|uniref:Transcription termination/antitermination protein NusG n=1 Tax=Symbiobacterium thermophilum TaxID=2734 RepID=A0A1Y2T5F6_SYMTR|nr:MAG: transcription termination/antitermination protein NusG [Symbiobacterium thermophilum]PZN71260.1 MAG: transcription termination/antitermination protein NusG [Bacillota bacterium]
MAEKRWYVVHTYSGYENKVKTNLEKRVESMEMQEKIFRVLVPMEDEIEIKDGKQKKVKRKVFPGYVLVEMVMSDDSWYVVRNTPGVTGFVGSGNKPVPLTDEEVEAILRRHSEGKPASVSVDFEIDQPVRVIAGPFKDHTGVIKELIPEKGKARVVITMFGRETPVEVDFNQIEEI